MRKRPLDKRLITLVRLKGDHYWTCSHCYWKVLMDANPVGALEEFTVHQCEDHPDPTGPLTVELSDPGDSAKHI